VAAESSCVERAYEPGASAVMFRVKNSTPGLQMMPVLERNQSSVIEFCWRTVSRVGLWICGADGDEATQLGGVVGGGVAGEVGTGVGVDVADSVNDSVDEAVAVYDWVKDSVADCVSDCVLEAVADSV